MGVTDYIDDERPLYVSTSDDLLITDFTDTSSQPHFVSAGIYGLTPRCFETLGRCIDRGEQRLRNFQRALVADGLHLQAWPFSKVLDIDHVTAVENDRAILEAVALRLSSRGHLVTQVDETLLASSLAADKPDFIFSMARLPESLRLLQASGIKVVNAPQGVSQCSRRHIG